MNILFYLVFVGATIQLIGALAYARDTWKGVTQPNRVSWLLWALAPLIGAAAAWTDGVSWAILPVFMAGFSPLIVLFASFANKKAYWKLGKFDYLCGAFAILALILWAITKQPLVAIVFAIISDALAGLPTVVKAWNHPESESSNAYIASLVSVCLGVFAIKNWVASEYLFTFYLILMNLAVIVAIYRKRLVFKK